jgi:hypothetical protein
MEQETPKVQATEQKDERTVSRRALIKAGWVIPAVMVVGIPKNALAMTGSDAGGGGGDHDSDHDSDHNSDHDSDRDSDRHYDFRDYDWGSLLRRLRLRWSWWGW